MPTGYTHALTERDLSFQEYALTCARAFGAFVHMRDEPLGAPLRPDTVTSYYDDKLTEAKADLDKFQHMSLEDARVLYNAERAERRTRAEQRIEEMKVIEARYRALKEKIDAWAPPTPEHQSLKRFMLEQLMVSASDYDSSYYAEDAALAPTVTDAEASEWVQEKIRAAIKQIGYCSDQRRKEQERVDQRNEWARQLQESLKDG
jgi:hypothetical protein